MQQTWQISTKTMSAVAQIERRNLAASDSQSPDAESMEAVGRLVSGVAHDFNNLLTGIVLCSDLILAGLDKNDRLRHYAEEIRCAANQGASLVRQLSAIARPEVAESRPLSLNEIIFGLHDLLARLIGEHIDVVAHLAENLDVIEMNPAQARQIVLNLALNARDAMPDGGQLTMTTCNITAPGNLGHQSRRYIEFVVRDTGIGMDDETRRRIFDPFFTTKGPDKGTGLGLPTVLSIVREHSGSIDIESQPGNGTTVTVRLPVQGLQIPKEGPQL